MSKPKQYEIDTLDKLFNVMNEENFDRLIIDFAQWACHVIQLNKLLREKMPEETKGKLNSELSKITFVWVDDGKHDLLNMRVTNPLTGEVTEKTFKRKK